MNNLTIRELLIQLITQHSFRNEDHINIIIETLMSRTGENFSSNVDRWIEWYLQSLAKEKDKRVVEASYKLFKMNEDIKYCK